jgi:hypothetical protein
MQTHNSCVTAIPHPCHAALSNVLALPSIKERKSQTTPDRAGHLPLLQPHLQLPADTTQAHHHHLLLLPHSPQQHCRLAALLTQLALLLLLLPASSVPAMLQPGS